MQGDWSLGLVAERLPPPPPSPDKGCLHQGLELVWRVWLLFPGCSYLGGGEHTRARGEDLTPPSCEVLGLRHSHQLS